MPQDVGYAEIHQSIIPSSWLCIGDFNEVPHREEHMGVNEWSNSQIHAFQDTVDVCELMDLGYTGTAWTFEKKISGVPTAGFGSIELWLQLAGASVSRLLLSST
jgi:hypothetical protein